MTRRFTPLLVAIAVVVGCQGEPEMKKVRGNSGGGGASPSGDELPPLDEWPMPDRRTAHKPNGKFRGILNPPGLGFEGMEGPRLRSPAKIASGFHEFGRWHAKLEGGCRLDDGIVKCWDNTGKPHKELAARVTDDFRRRRQGRGDLDLPGRQLVLVKLTAKNYGGYVKHLNLVHSDVFIPLRKLAAYPEEPASYRGFVVDPEPGQKTTMVRLEERNSEPDHFVIGYKIGSKVDSKGLTYTLTSIDPYVPAESHPGEASGKLWKVTFTITGKSDYISTFSIRPCEESRKPLTVIDTESRLVADSDFYVEAPAKLELAGPDEKVVMSHRSASAVPIPQLTTDSEINFAVNFTTEQPGKLLVSLTSRRYLDLVGARLQPR